ncbi:sensor histidine kinase [Comamonas squillarum]|uniref:histidine kinase n=1 Tax=Comamonas squillarum TaxID=2977320 RepID=A0ABY5ZZ46_9BURK|nr:sensor histidine kinase [Comamonas sp. PR12]UXC19285.1 sensor histidine kinase [Comamonas sp. PR12]
MAFPPSSVHERPPARRSPARRWSLAARMAALVIVPSLLVMGLGGWWLRYEVHASLLGSMSRSLEEKSERIHARLALLPDGRVQEAAGGSDEFSAIFSGWYWQLQGQARAPLRTAAEPVVLARSRSLWDQPDLVVSPARLWGSERLQQARGPQQEPLLVQHFSVQLAAGAAPMHLQVFGPAQPLMASLRRIDQILGITSAMLILLIGALVWLQLRVGLAPLKRLVGVIAGLDKPLPGAAPATEQIAQLPLGADLQPLQQELAALLARNTQVVERSRSHAADLNHALKKPLSLLMAHAGSGAALPADLVLQQTTAMARLIDRYQARTFSDATLVHGPSAGLPVDVLACARQMLAMLRQLHQASDLDWQLVEEGVALWWRGERADLEELLGNLLDNAGKWAASQVRLTVYGRATQGLVLQVEDDGPGMTAAQMQAAGARGQRFDETVDGTGLGLSITQQIVQGYEGRLQWRKSEALKGLLVRVEMAGVVA